MRNIEQICNLKSYVDVKNYFTSKQANGMRIGVGLGVCQTYLETIGFGNNYLHDETYLDWRKYFIIKFTATVQNRVILGNDGIETVYVKVPFTPTNVGRVLAFYKKAITLETVERFMEINKRMAQEIDFQRYSTVNFNNIPLTRKDIEERDVIHRFGGYLTLENSHCFIENYNEISSMMDYCGMFNGFTKSHISKIMENALRYSWCVGFSPKRFSAARQNFHKFFANNIKDIPKNYMMFENSWCAENCHPKNTTRVITDKNYLPRNGAKFKSPAKTRNDAIRRLIFLLNSSCVEITFN